MKAIINLLRWIARSLAILSVALLIGFIFGNEEPVKFNFSSVKELITFLLFPVLTIVGLTLSLKYEKKGSLLVMAAMAGLFLIRSDLTQNIYFYFFLIPAFIFLFLAYYNPKEGV
jgi:uncharacterized membrane protein YccC